eukprot:14562976-Ditylum_brightwellii.AAC.1
MGGNHMGEEVGYRHDLELGKTSGARKVWSCMILELLMYWDCGEEGPVASIRATQEMVWRSEMLDAYV